MLKSSFRAKFLHCLNNGNLSLDERLCMVYGALVSQQFILNGKEQIIIDWFADCLKENVSLIKPILKTLTKCLKSDWLLTFCDTIDASKLIEVFLELDSDIKHRHGKKLTNCLLLVLKNAGFQRYCRFDIQPMCEAVLLTCELMSNIISNKGSLEDSFIEADVLNVSSGLEYLFEYIQNIHKITQERSELKKRFIKFILPKLLSFNYNFQQCVKFQNLMEELVIGEDTKRLCEAFKSSSSKKVPYYLKALGSLMTEDQQNCDVVVLNSLLLDVYIQSCMKKAGSDYIDLSLFYILSSVAGFKVELPYDTVHIPGEPRLSILRELVTVLQKHNIPVSTESEEGILAKFLTAIQRQLVSENYPLSSELLQTIQIVFRVHPEGMKQVFPEYIQHIMFVTKSDTKLLKYYNNLLSDVMQLFFDLKQIKKFFSLFFHRAVLLSKENNFSELQCEMVLSSGFFTVLSENLPSLTGNQLKLILGRLEKTFSQNLISPLENNNGTEASYHLVLKLMVQIVCHILENTCIVLPTRWSIISEEMTNITLAVQTFGVTVIKNPVIELLWEFLQLVRIITDIQVMMNQFTISLSSTNILPTVKSKKTKGSVNDLSKSHGFLTAKDWECVCTVVSESNDKQLIHCWYDLMLQKYMRLNDDEVIPNLTKCAASEWLWQTVAQVSAVVPLSCLEMYTDRLLDNISASSDDGFTDRLTALTNINVVINRPFRAAVSLKVVTQISGMLSEKGSVSKTLTDLIDVESIIKHEAEPTLSDERAMELKRKASEMAKVINTCSWKKSSVVISTENKHHVTRMFDLLAVTSPHCLKTETKQIMCVVLMGLGYDLRAEDTVLKNILDNILGLMDDNSSVIPDSLKRHVLLQWLVAVVPTNYSLRQELMLIAINKVITTLDHCLKYDTSLVQNDEDVMCAMLESLIQAHENKRIRSNENIYEFVKTVVSWASSGVVKKPKAKYLRLYVASLKAECLCFKDSTCTLLELLPSYLEILFRKFAENAVIEPNATELIDIVLSLKTELESHITDRVYKGVTTELCKTDLCPLLCYPSTVRAFLESLPAGRFEEVLTTISKHHQESLSSEKATLSISNVCELWNIIVSAHLDKDKAKIRQKLLVKVVSECQPLLEKDVTQIQPVVLQLLQSIVLSKSVVLSWKLMDLILAILEDTPTDTEAYLLPDCLSVLASLISVQPELVFDRIPAFLQRLRKFVKSLVLLSSTDNGDSVAFNNMTKSSMNQVTRIIKTISDHHQKHFTRIAPYLVADLLHLLVTYSIETSIKNELQNCVCSVLNICDHHGTQLLQNLLPLPAIELFKVISTTYHKSYKYTGKV